jgi:pimeloyl-ACP methyl ester carboxylesterase
MTQAKSLNIQITGSGQPALLFVHGFGCSLDDWRAQVEALSGQFTCITLDLPGHGSSPLPAAATMVELANAVNTAKEACGAQEIILIGHSLGCKVIREAYSQSPKNVMGMVLIEGAFYSGEAEQLVKLASGLIDQEGFTSYASRHFEEMFVESSDEDQKKRVLARLPLMDTTFGRNLYLEAVRWDPARSLDTLRQMEVPALVLQTTYHDGALRKRQPLSLGMSTPFMDVVRELVKDSDALVIPGAGHFPMFEAPEVINHELRSFALRVADDAICRSK